MCVCVHVCAFPLTPNILLSVGDFFFFPFGVFASALYYNMIVWRKTAPHWMFVIARLVNARQRANRSFPKHCVREQFKKIEERKKE